MTLGGPVTRDGAREEARRELSKHIYRSPEPSWWSRAVRWIDDKIGDLVHWLLPGGDGLGGGSGGLGVLALVLVLVVVAVALRWWLGPVRRSARTRREDDDLSSSSTAAQLRAEADGHATRGAYAEAVRSRLRAIVRMLEEKGVLDPRPGRTAGELVEDVARIAPSPDGGPPRGGPDGGHPRGGTDRPGAAAGAAGDGPGTALEPAAALAAAVEVFSEIWYGGRPASAAGYQVLVEADRALAQLRRGTGGTGGTGSADTLAVPA
ncbi:MULTISPECIES: DUF4129 domain-containing protein [unclassified Frankia]